MNVMFIVFSEYYIFDSISVNCLGREKIVQTTVLITNDYVKYNITSIYAKTPNNNAHCMYGYKWENTT